jgi:transcriptional regulator with XRE-family HTH domain
MLNETLCATFGATIRARRIALGLTQQTVAAAVGWTRAEMVSLVESGDRMPNLNRIPKLAKGLVLDPAALCRFALAECYPALYETLFGDAAPVTPGSAEK